MTQQIREHVQIWRFAAEKEKNVNIKGNETHTKNISANGLNNKRHVQGSLCFYFVVTSALFSKSDGRTGSPICLSWCNKRSISFKALFWSIDQIRWCLIFWWSRHLLLKATCYFTTDIVQQFPSRSLEPEASKYGKNPKTHGIYSKNICFCVSPCNATCTEHTEDRGQLEPLKSVTPVCFDPSEVAWYVLLFNPLRH